MSTISRISNRISAALSSVRCPGCEQFVVPAPPAPAPEPPGDAAPGGRWSFIWVAPSGDVCPQCGFPLARYARRLKWIRLFITGVVLLTGAMLLYVFTMMSGSGPGLKRAAQAAAIVGLLAFLTGLGGIVIGGRRRADGGGRAP